MATGEAIERTWEALRRDLERRALELRETVRSYPQPIARCDAQLPGIIAERDAAVRALRAAEELEAARGVLDPQEWKARVLEFAASLGADGGDPPVSAA